MLIRRGKGLNRATTAGHSRVPEQPAIELSYFRKASAHLVRSTDRRVLSILDASTNAMSLLLHDETLCVCELRHGPAIRDMNRNDRYFPSEQTYKLQSENIRENASIKIAEGLARIDIRIGSSKLSNIQIHARQGIGPKGEKISVSEIWLLLSYLRDCVAHATITNVAGRSTMRAVSSRSALIFV